MKKTKRGRRCERRPCRARRRHPARRRRSPGRRMRARPPRLDAACGVARRQPVQRAAGTFERSTNRGSRRHCVACSNA
ncbi:hypothetical protein D8O27_19810 [Burkholderia mallei]|uniref:Uncharacterized protein n=1 Tax=Burkholderia mallei TaxID=13373 RepID=A0AAX1XFJ7_BURML|nr:hypothetical protein [Burkholderia pseudomallei]RKO19089.1 hypothetical protein D8O30_17635 [Burkholderia mallei]QBP62776.1 hypothetical protein E2R29_15470 [Burkholderia pseudomallei]RKO27082.1 hypothetical protein D8O27_19810 [Burkholderia mallei]RPA10446.1 hypothetical protein EGT58_000260 [Burkholderia mallei]